MIGILEITPAPRQHRRFQNTSEASPAETQQRLPQQVYASRRPKEGPTDLQTPLHAQYLRQDQLQAQCHNNHYTARAPTVIPAAAAQSALQAATTAASAPTITAHPDLAPCRSRIPRRAAPLPPDSTSRQSGTLQRATPPRQDSAQRQSRIPRPAAPRPDMAPCLSGTTGACSLTSPGRHQQFDDLHLPSQSTQHHMQPIRYSAAGGRGSSSAPPVGPVADHEMDNGYEAASAFYRNATFHRVALDSIQPPLILTELPIEPFDGDIRRYPTFRDRFLDVVEGHPGLAPRHKLQYLLQLLRGEPFQLANNYQLTDANYYIIVDSLEERYGDQYRLRRQLAQDFIAIRPPAGGVADLRRFHDAAFRITTDLRKLGENLDETVLYEQTLVAKLPAELKLEIVRNSEYRREKTVKSILDGLREYANLFDEVCNSGIMFQPPPPAPPVAATRKRLRSPPPPARSPSESSSEESTESSEVAEDEQQATCAAKTVVINPTDEQHKCQLCGQLHMADNCIVYTTVNHRLRRLQKLSLCPLCLREGHRVDSCPRRGTDSCSRCDSGTHHRATCRAAENGSRSETRRRSSKCATRGSKDDRESSERHSRTLKKHAVDREATTVVATATKPRQSGTRRSPTKVEDNPNNRKKRSKNAGTRSKGRSTTRPKTTSTDESVKQKGVDACDVARLLSGLQALLATARRPTNNGSPKFDRAQDRAGSRESSVQDPDADGRRHEHWDEDESYPSSVGHCSDVSSNGPSDAESNDYDRFPTCKRVRAYVASASTNDAHAPLLECVQVTAANPANGLTRKAIVFFDSGSDFSYVSQTLSRDLNLPFHGKCVRRVHAFGSTSPATVEGFFTSVVLRSSQGRQIPLDASTADFALPPVRTALVEDADLPRLRRKERNVTPIQVAPDILIGQDRFQLFGRHTGPRLPTGFDIVHTILGPTIGGAPQVAATQPKAVQGSSAKPAMEATRACIGPLQQPTSGTADTSLPETVVSSTRTPSQRPLLQAADHPCQHSRCNIDDDGFEQNSYIQPARSRSNSEKRRAWSGAPQFGPLPTVGSTATEATSSSQQTATETLVDSRFGPLPIADDTGSEPTTLPKEPATETTGKSDPAPLPEEEADADAATSAQASPTSVSASSSIEQSRKQPTSAAFAALYADAFIPKAPWRKLWRRKKPNPLDTITKPLPPTLHSVSAVAAIAGVPEVRTRPPACAPSRPPSKYNAAPLLPPVASEAHSPACVVTSCSAEDTADLHSIFLISVVDDTMDTNQSADDLISPPQAPLQVPQQPPSTPQSESLRLNGNPPTRPVEAAPRALDAGPSHHFTVNDRTADNYASPERSDGDASADATHDGRRYKYCNIGGILNETTLDVPPNIADSTRPSATRFGPLPVVDSTAANAVDFPRQPGDQRNHSASRFGPLPIVDSAGAAANTPQQPANQRRPGGASRFGPLPIVDSASADSVITPQNPATQAQSTRSDLGHLPEKDRAAEHATKDLPDAVHSSSSLPTETERRALAADLARTIKGLYGGTILHAMPAELMNHFPDAADPGHNPILDSILEYVARKTTTLLADRYPTLLKGIPKLLTSDGLPTTAEVRSSVTQADAGPAPAYAALVAVARADPLDQENNTFDVLTMAAAHLVSVPDPVIPSTPATCCAPAEALPIAKTISVTHLGPVRDASGEAALSTGDTRVLGTIRDDSPLKNETVCFFDGSTFLYFGCLLRPEVLMVLTPMSSLEGALRSVCKFQLSSEVRRVIFWLSDSAASPLSPAVQLRLITELSQHYTTKYPTVTQYVVATPFVGSRQDVWTCGLFKLLVQMQVLLPFARLVMNPRGSRSVTQADVYHLKRYLRDHHHLNLWRRYDADIPQAAKASYSLSTPQQRHVALAATSAHRTAAGDPQDDATPKDGTTNAATLTGTARHPGRTRPQSHDGLRGGSAASAINQFPPPPSRSRFHLTPLAQLGPTKERKLKSRSRSRPARPAAKAPPKTNSRGKKEQTCRDEIIHRRSRDLQSPTAPAAASNQPVKQKPSKSRFGPLPVVDGTVTVSDEQQGAARNICAFCDQSHWASKCVRYRTVAQRARRARELGYCFVCLRVGHAAQTCPSGSTSLCRLCERKRHHRALCPLAPSNASTTKASFRQLSPVTSAPCSIAATHTPDTKIANKRCKPGRAAHTTYAPTAAQMPPTSESAKAQHRRKTRKRKDREPKK
ncbi:Zinc knuckle family protein [Aphelenchoides avenae]|nr:Zinc knuckle family protein [Aphelenchus avenae]